MGAIFIEYNFVDKKGISIFAKPLYLFAPMLIQMNLSEDEIRVLNYKIFEENSSQIQKRLLAV
jgi:hypothetical protein